MTMFVSISSDKNGIESAVSLVQGLDVSIQPKYFSEDEDPVKRKRFSLEDARLFKNFRLNNPLGYFLFSKVCKFNFSFSDLDNSELTVWFEKECKQEWIDQLIQLSLEIGVDFAYACTWSEYEDRNKIKHTIGMNHLESICGLDSQKYISGLYWTTVISQKLVDKFSLDIQTLSDHSHSFEKRKEGDVFIFRFFEGMSEWKEHSEELNNLCDQLLGIFSKKGSLIGSKRKSLIIP